MFYTQINKYHTERILHSQKRKTYSEGVSNVYLVDLYIKFLGHIFFSFVQVFWTFFSKSGLEDIVYQADACTSGNLLNVMKESHYNCAWLVHNAESEAMERFLMLRFFGELNI